jgi:hypothetical protein
VVAVATLNPNTSPTETAVVQPVLEPFCASCAEERVKGADAEILFPEVGIAPAAFHTSTVMLPDWSAEMSMRLIVQAKSDVG